MAEIALYAKDKRLVTEAGALLPTNVRPIVRWREQDTFTLRLADGGEFPEGAYHYAFDIDRDFLHTPPCNTGSCEITGGALVFTVTFNAVTMAEATNGRRNPLPFYIQITRDGSSVAEYIIDDAIWADGCVWDGFGPPAEPASDYYTKEEMDAIVLDVMDARDEAVSAKTDAVEAGDEAVQARDESVSSSESAGASALLAESYATVAEDAMDGANDAQALAETAQAAAESAAGNAADATGAAITAQFAEALSKVAGQVASAQAAANSASASQVSAAGNAANSNVWAEGTDAQVAELGGQHSAKRWAEIGGGGGPVNWDDIEDKPEFADVATTGNYDDLTDKPTVPDAATNAQTDSRSASQDIRPSNVEYAVRSVLPNVTTIPAATTAYSLLDASATTNNHSWQYSHSPTGIPTYTLPAVTNAAIAHEILLDVDFTTVQACGFVDSQSAEIPLQSDIAIAAGDKWRFICVYSLDGWRVYPLPVEMAGGGGGGASTLIVQGTTATSAGLAGTYEITSDTVNDHPIWFNSTNSKYLWLVENGMDAGYYGWVIGSTVAQQSAGDIPMFYEYFVADVTSPADTPVGLTWRTQMDELTAAQFTCVEG